MPNSHQLMGISVNAKFIDYVLQKTFSNTYIIYCLLFVCEWYRSEAALSYTYRIIIVVEFLYNTYVPNCEELFFQTMISELAIAIGNSIFGLALIEV